MSVLRVEESYSAASLRRVDQAVFAALPDGSLGTAAIATSVSDLFDDRIALVQTIGPIEFNDDPQNRQPRAGRIQAVPIGIDDPDSLLIDVFNGDPSSFNFTVNIAGVTTTYTIPFSETRQIRFLFTDGVDTGF